MSSEYSIKDYREFLFHRAKARKQRDVHFKYAELAKAMRIQPTYLSRVFKKLAHLNGDQIFLFCRAMQLSEVDREFIVLLFEYDRAGVVERRAQLKEKLLKLQQELIHATKHLQVQAHSEHQDPNLYEYYLDPFCPLVHAFLMVPKYQRDPSLISQALNLDYAQLNRILQTLSSLKIIEQSTTQNKVKLLREHIHLAPESKLEETFQILFRHLCVDGLKRIPKERKQQLSVSFSADEDTKLRIREEFNKFIKEVEGLVREAPSEGVYQLNFDFFQWDQNK